MVAVDEMRRLLIAVEDREVVANGLEKARESRLLSTFGMVKVSTRVTLARLIQM